MPDLCFAFSPVQGTSTLALQHVPTFWDGKQSTELCVLGQLSLLKSQERESCMKQMNKGQGTGAGLGGFLRTMACLLGDCAFSPLPSSSESSLIWPLINKSRNFVWPSFQWRKKWNFHLFFWRDVFVVYRLCSNVNQQISGSYWHHFSKGMEAGVIQAGYKRRCVSILR